MASVDDYLWFSQATYDDPDVYKNPPSGWSYLRQSDPNSDGYFGVAYKDNDTGEIVVANRGSRLSAAGLKEDWAGSDAQIAAQGALGIPASFQQANNFANEIISENPGAPISFTGHSLGGAEAQVQAATSGLRATTFGAPGAAFAVDSDAAEASRNSITNYVLPGDVIGESGDHIGRVVPLAPASGTLMKDLAVIVVSAALPGLLAPLALLLGLIWANHPLSNYEAAIADLDGSDQTDAAGGQPAARITDNHVCPMVTGVVPHVGGPIVLGSPNVFTGSMAQARVSDMLVCVGPPDAIAKGSATVFVNDLPAARLGDQTAHGGAIVSGYPTVLVGG
jgi:uncharacterized Zn-binding protein involved in type VI secretion